MWSLLDVLHSLLCLLLWPLRLTSWGAARAKFEAQKDSTIFRADWSCEISSEGEYEQVRPWVMELLQQGRQIEIVFASESVEKGMLALKEAYPQQVKLMRLPLLTHTPGDLQKFITARYFVMCRYDFFPMLMRFAAQSEIKSGLVWASFKGRRERLQNPLWRAWYRWFFSAFDWIIPATSMDETLFRSIHPNVLGTVDFRVGQIQQRVENKAATLQQKFPQWNEFQQRLHKIPWDKRVVLGSAWESDLALLQNPEWRRQILSGEMMVMIVPHQISEQWKNILAALDYPVYEVKPGQALPSVTTPGLWLINLRGVLCELYSEVGKVYVGGGFERSIHSVMEPFVAGSHIWCGPKTHRSTEAELIQSVEPKLFHRLEGHQALSDSLLSAKHDAEGPDHRRLWIDNQAQKAREYFQTLKD